MIRKYKEISSENDYIEFEPIASNEYDIKDDKSIVELSVRGSFIGTLTLQRQFPDTEMLGVNAWGAVDEIDGETENQIVCTKRGMKYRIGFLTGSYTSGTAKVEVI